MYATSLPTVGMTSNKCPIDIETASIFVGIAGGLLLVYSLWKRRQILKSRRSTLITDRKHYYPETLYNYQARLLVSGGHHRGQPPIEPPYPVVSQYSPPLSSRWPSLSPNLSRFDQGLANSGTSRRSPTLVRSEPPPLLSNIGAVGDYQAQTTFDSRYKIRFEHAQPFISQSDRVKNFIERYAGMPVLWWPLCQPTKVLPDNHSRISWILESGKSISVDIPTTSALKFQERCIQPTSCANDSSSGTTPPTCTPNTGTTSSTSQDAGSSRQRQTQAAQSNTSNSAGSTSLRTQSISVNSNEKYIHWCVDSSRSETNLYHICVESPSSAKNGIEFISELRKSYKKSRGIRRLFSLTTCAEIKLVKFMRAASDKDLVWCLKYTPTLSDIQQETEYHAEPILPEEFYTVWVEKTLCANYHDPTQNDEQLIQDLISHIPKKITGKLESKAKTFGYGIHAVHGWCWYKFVVAIVMSQVPALSFAAYRLYHKGDLQNAFTPAVYLLALLGVGVALPDYYIK